jgi:hypothetical protein
MAEKSEGPPVWKVVAGMLMLLALAAALLWLAAKAIF